MAPKRALVFLLFAFFSSELARADELTRQVQEELRKRHLFFRDIDGRNTPEYSIALKRYQARQGFPATGEADSVTLYSLGIGEIPQQQARAGELPNIPILKSDAAPPEQKAAPLPSISKVANAGDATKGELRAFIRRYFDASESPNPQDELAFYADRVDYFDHGLVDKSYIQNELAVYDQRWPQRKYSMGDSIRIMKNGDKTVAKFRVGFQLANPGAGRNASGSVDDTFGIGKRSDSSLEIISMREARVRQGSRPRRRPPDAGAAVGRTVRKVFRSIFPSTHSRSRSSARRRH